MLQKNVIGLVFAVLFALTLWPTGASAAAPVCHRKVVRHAIAPPPAPAPYRPVYYTQTQAAPVYYPPRSGFGSWLGDLISAPFVVAGNIVGGVAGAVGTVAESPWCWRSVWNPDAGMWQRVWTCQ